eukprot:TRINITY_DN14909_c0_g1_i1.p1 TRINITY_DN14909_c0_g1~~TRINITY_DN14909_c0_g1_i1.p1  ORF type:complete len:236 (+),score=71.49 TRINITY_DN14909_c0_g1_i1:70-777(+)
MPPKRKRQEMTREEKAEYYKKQQQKQRAKQREQIKEDRAEMKAAAAPGDHVELREGELAAVGRQLDRRCLKLHEVQSDGNCLYRSVAHQLSLHGRDMTYVQLRRLCAEELRRNPEKYQPFVVDEAGDAVSDAAFAAHCATVESSSEWGGQTELEALAQAISSPIVVLQAQGPDQRFGDEFGSAELVLVYHKHFMMLGEHYNSCVPAVRGGADPGWSKPVAGRQSYSDEQAPAASD